MRERRLRPPQWEEHTGSPVLIIADQPLLLRGSRSSASFLSWPGTCPLAGLEGRGAYGSEGSRSVPSDEWPYPLSLVSLATSGHLDSVAWQNLSQFGKGY